MSWSIRSAGILELLVLVFVLTFLNTSCGEKKHEERSLERQGPQSNNMVEEDFETFYARFHSDSLYQIEHIVFPLQGLPPRVDSLTLARDNFHWQPQQWRMHRPLDPRDKDFRRELDWIGQEMVREYIINTRTGYGLERRFAVINDEWHLIYYAAMNQLARPEG